MVVAGAIGWPELLVILGILLVLFGAKRLPDLARSLGRSVKELQDGLEEGIAEGAEESESLDETEDSAKGS